MVYTNCFTTRVAIVVNKETNNSLSFNEKSSARKKEI
jgi:hypothetical protein